MSSWKEYNGGNVKISNINEWDEELLVKKKELLVIKMNAMLCED